MRKIFESILHTIDVISLPHTENVFQDKMDAILRRSDCESLNGDWQNVGGDIATAINKTQKRLNEQTGQAQELQQG